MKKTALVFLIVLLLTACTPQSILFESGKKAEKTTQEKTVSIEELKTQVQEVKEKYNDPKWATLRLEDYQGVGRVFMQYDKDLDKTFVWTELTKLTKPEAGNKYVLWLVDNTAEEEAKKRLNLGELLFDIDNVAFAYYEFEKNGNFYNYLKAQATVEPEEGEVTGKNVLLEANFNPKLL